MKCCSKNNRVEIIGIKSGSPLVVCHALLIHIYQSSETHVLSKNKYYSPTFPVWIQLCPSLAPCQEPFQVTDFTSILVEFGHNSFVCFSHWNSCPNSFRVNEHWCGVTAALWLFGISFSLSIVALVASADVFSCSVGRMGVHRLLSFLLIWCGFWCGFEGPRSSTGAVNSDCAHAVRVGSTTRLFEAVQYKQWRAIVQHKPNRSVLYATSVFDLAKDGVWRVCTWDCWVLCWLSELLGIEEQCQFCYLSHKTVKTSLPRWVCWNNSQMDSFSVGRNTV